MNCKCSVLSPSLVFDKERK